MGLHDELRHTEVRDWHRCEDSFQGQSWMCALVIGSGLRDAVQPSCLWSVCIICLVNGNSIAPRFGHEYSEANVDPHEVVAPAVGGPQHLSWTLRKILSLVWV